MAEDARPSCAAPGASRSRRPNFFIVGAPKCGTTAWVRYLEDHPDVYFSPSKEPHYFCTDFPTLGAATSQAPGTRR